MRSDSGLANVDLYGTQRALRQPDPALFIPKGADVTQTKPEAEPSRGTARLQQAPDVPGIETAEEVGYAAKLQELSRARDVAMPEVRVEWGVAFYVQPLASTQDEARLAHESVRSRIDAMARVDSSELSEGAIPPTTVSREVAISAVEALYHGRGLLFHHVSPLPDGGVELEFDSPQLYIGLWIYDRDNIDVVVRKRISEHTQKVRIDQLSDVIWEQLVRA